MANHKANKGSFKKGHKLSKGGSRPNSGRPKWQESLDRKAREMAIPLAAGMAAKELEKCLGGILDTYVLAAGGELPFPTRGRPKKVPYDPTTNRHAIDRFVPPAPRKIDLGLADTFEDFADKVVSGHYEKIFKEKYPDATPAEIVESQPDKPKEEGDDVL